ncbi:MAG: hypothetical protein IT210_26015 [Armatimonadetes bacterium]|nr:hypothetical protein [Armatimonadota bacterium]
MSFLGEPEILKEAWVAAREEISCFTFCLPEDRQREVDRLYEEGGRRIRG